MASAVHPATSSINLQVSQNANMNKKVKTCLEITTATKPLIITSVNLKENQMGDTGKEVYDPYHRRTLFVKFPCKIKNKEEVKLLYPGIEAVRFKPRIKSWCHIRFNSEQVAKHALKELHKKKMKYGQLIVTETKKSKINKSEDKSKKKPRWHKLYVKNLPEDVTESEIISAFPGCANVRIIPPNKRRTIGALIGFKALDKMEAVISKTKIHKVRDRDVLVSYSKAYLHGHDLLKQEQQKISNSSEMLKTSARKQTIVTPKSLGKMVEASLSKFEDQDNDSNGDDTEEEGRCKEDIKMDTGSDDENTDGDGDGSVSDGNTDEVSSHDAIDGAGDSDEDSQDEAIDMEDEAIENYDDDVINVKSGDDNGDGSCDSASIGDSEDSDIVDDSKESVAENFEDDDDDDDSVDISEK